MDNMTAEFSPLRLHFSSPMVNSLSQNLALSHYIKRIRLFSLPCYLSSCQKTSLWWDYNLPNDNYGDTATRAKRDFIVYWWKIEMDKGTTHNRLNFLMEYLPWSNVKVHGGRNDWKSGCNLTPTRHTINEINSQPAKPFSIKMRANLLSLE